MNKYKLLSESLSKIPQEFSDQDIVDVNSSILTLENILKYTNREYLLEHINQIKKEVK